MHFTRFRNFLVNFKQNSVFLFYAFCEPKYYKVENTANKKLFKNKPETFSDQYVDLRQKKKGKRKGKS